MSVRRSLVASVTNRFAGVIMQILSSLVIARLLAPAEFGLFGIASSVIAVSSSLREFGVTSYLIRLDTIDRHALGRALAFTMSISLTAGTVIFLSRHAIAAFFRDDAIAGLIAILCLNFILIPPTIGAAAIIQRNLRFATLSLCQLGCLVAALAATIAMAASGLGPTSLAIGQVLQMALFLLCMTILDWRAVLVLPVFRGMGEMIRFGSFAALSGVTNQLGTYTTSLVLGRLLGPAAVGIYDRGNGMYMPLASDLVVTIGNVLYVGLSRVRHDSAALARLLLEAMRNLTAITWPGFLLLAALADPLITLMFGPPWAASVPVLQILCLSGLLTSATNLYYQTVLTMGATQRILAIELAGQSTRIAGILALATFGVTGAATAAVIAMAVIFILYLAAARRYIHARRRDILHIYTESLALAAATATAPALLVLHNPLALPPLPLLAISGTIGLATWLIAILATHHPLATELRTAATQITSRVWPPKDR